MKKVVAILLALMILLGLSTTAFASDDATLTIADTANERTYAGYQILNLSTSLKNGDHHPATCNGVDHADDCYNYAYSVNAKYLSILQAETLANGRNEIWVSTGKPTDPAAVTEAQILEYLSYQTSDSGETFGTLRLVADRIYREIKEQGIAADEASLTGNADEIAQGYWLIADTTELDGENDANSLVMVDTKGQSDITVTPKVAIPTVEKKVKDIDDSEDATISDNPWHDSADHDIDDAPIPFKLTATLPSNAQYYHTYKMVFHDSLSSGLTLDADSFKVLMYDTKYKADVDVDLNDAAKDVTANFVVKTSDLEDNCTFEVSCDNVFAISGVTKETAFVVYYEAALNESAVIGAAGNPNEVYLEFSNDPYDDGTGTTESDKVIVFTYQLTVNKTDSHGHPLEGAGFTLYKKNVDGTYNAIGEELKGDAMTTFSWTGLDDGDYKLVETTVPEGYNKMADVVFSVSAVHSETAGEPILISLDGGMMGTGVVETGTITKDIVNNTGTILPETGAKGTIMLITVSVMFVGVAAIFMITRKKMSIYED